MAALQKGLSCQAADQALMASLVKTAPVGCSQAVADYLRLRGLNQVLSPKLHLPVLLGQEVVAMIHSEALNSCQLAQEKGNEEPV